MKDDVQSIDDTRTEDLKEPPDMSLHPSELEEEPLSGALDDDTPEHLLGSIDTVAQEL